MPFAELGPFSQSKAKLLALLIPGPFAELRAVQPEQSQIVGFANSWLHCTTLRVVIRQNHDK